jgi:1-acyl-sn-glycerol-3-phosphate acyltransferase
VLTALLPRLLDARQRRRLARLRLADQGHGYDLFGMSRDWVAAADGLLRLPYERYFRVESVGAENLPAAGAAILAANHGGMLPIDAMMLYRDVLGHTDPPRVARPIADLFVPALPFIGTLFARVGVVAGSRQNVHHLLDHGELVMVFPEGTSGIGKPWRERHRLQGWTVGHAELAIRHRVPVIPTAIVGPDEQWPQLGRIRQLQLFGAPYLPVPLLPLPLPVRYHIRYGAPLQLHERLTPADADDPRAVQLAAGRVAFAVEQLLAESLQARAGLFR